MLWMPPASAAEVMLQLPEPSAVADPTNVLPSSNCTSAPASDVPLNTGVVTFVTLSVLELPLSLAAARSGLDTAGPAVSIVTTSAAEVELFPAKSDVRAVMLCAPSVSVLEVIDQLPE